MYMIIIYKEPYVLLIKQKKKKSQKLYEIDRPTTNHRPSPMIRQQLLLLLGNDKSGWIGRHTNTLKAAY